MANKEKRRKEHIVSSHGVIGVLLVCGSIVFVGLFLWLTSLPRFDATLLDGHVHAQELVHERTANAKVFDLGNGLRRAEFHTIPIHYTDAGGALQDIDPTIVLSDRPEYEFEVEEGVYHAYFGDYYTDEQLLAVEMNGKEIAVQAGDLTVVSSDGSFVAHVNEPQPVRGLPAGNQLLYENAYGEGLDVAVTYANHAIKRELVIADRALIPDIAHGDFLDLGFAFSIPVDHSLVVVVDGKEWDQNTVVTEDPVLFLNAEGNIVFSLDAPLGRDATGRPGVPLSYRVSEEGGFMHIQKLIPMSWLDQAVHPVYVDDVVSGGFTEDAYVWASNVDYSRAQTSPTGDSFLDSDTTIGLGQMLSGGTYYVYRSLFYFDTSSIGASSTITAASLQFWGSTDLTSGGDFDMTIVEWTGGPAISTADFSQTGTTTYGALTTAGLQTGGTSNVITFSDTSIINQASSTYLGLVSSKDLSATAPTSFEYVALKSKDWSGTDQDPVFSVTYNPPISGDPGVASWTSLTQSSSTQATGQLLLTDPESDPITVAIEYAPDGGSFSNATLSTSTAGAVSGHLIENVPHNTTVEFVWDIATDAPNVEQTYILRATPLSGVAVTTSVAIDTRKPQNLGPLVFSTTTASTATFLFGNQATDANFWQYKIFHAPYVFTAGPNPPPDGDLNDSGGVNVSDVSCAGLMVTWESGGRDPEAIPICVNESEVDAAATKADIDCSGVIVTADQNFVLDLSTTGLDAAVDANDNDIHDDCEGAFTTVSESDTALTSSTIAALGASNFLGATTTVLTGLVTGTKQVANIWAFDTFSQSTSSDQVIFFTLTEPGGLSVVASTTDPDTFRMTVSRQTNPDDALIEYAVCRTTNQTTCATYFDTSGNSTGSIVWATTSQWSGTTGFDTTGWGSASNTSYSFFVQSRNASDTPSGLSSVVSTYSLAKPVSSISLADSTSASAFVNTISFSATDLSGLKIERDAACDGSYETITDTVSSTPSSPYTDSGLAASTCYQYRFSSYNGDGVIGADSIVVSGEITTPASLVVEATTGGGGGGGGGASLIPQSTTLTGAKINGASENVVTNDSEILITPVGASALASEIAVSFNASFSGAIWTSYEDDHLFTLPQSEGLYTLYIKVREPNGAESSVIVSEVVLLLEETIDPPSIVVPADGGTVSTLPFTISGNGQPGATVSLTVGGSTYTVTADLTGAFAVDVLDILIAGTYTIQASQSNAFGATSEQIDHAFVFSSVESEDAQNQEDASVPPTADQDGSTDATPSAPPINIIETDIVESEPVLPVSVDQVDELVSETAESEDPFLLVLQPKSVQFHHQQINSIHAVAGGKGVDILLRPSVDVHSITARLYPQDQHLLHQDDDRNALSSLLVPSVSAANPGQPWVRAYLFERSTVYNAVFEENIDLQNISHGDYELVITLNESDGKRTHISKHLNVQKRGQVLGKLDRPVSGARVAILRKEDDAFMLWNGELLGQANPTFSEDDGSYAVEVPPGEYKYVVEATGYKGFESGVVRITEPQLLNRTLRLQVDSLSLWDRFWSWVRNVLT